jgi:hypothetical protein
VHDGIQKELEGLPMTITATNQSVVRTLNDSEIRSEIASLLTLAAMSRDELGRRGEKFELDASERGLLAEIEGLEWLLARG